MFSWAIKLTSTDKGICLVDGPISIKSEDHLQQIKDQHTNEFKYGFVIAAPKEVLLYNDFGLDSSDFGEELLFDTSGMELMVESDKC